MQAIRAYSDRDNTLGALADHVISEEHQAEEEPSMRAEKMESMIWTTLLDDITGVSEFVKDIVSTLVTSAGQNEVS